MQYQTGKAKSIYAFGIQYIGFTLYIKLTLYKKAMIEIRLKLNAAQYATTHDVLQSNIFEAITKGQSIKSIYNNNICVILGIVS